MVDLYQVDVGKYTIHRSYMDNIPYVDPVGMVAASKKNVFQVSFLFRVCEAHFPPKKKKTYACQSLLPTFLGMVFRNFSGQLIKKNVTWKTNPG